MSSCSNYNGCVDNSRQTLAYPIDQESLYADRIYDNQTTNRRCYEKKPINIVEGFGKRRINRIIRWIIIIIILYILLTMLMQFMQPGKVFAIELSPVRNTPRLTGETIKKFFQ